MIDRLAGEGVRFTQFYASPVCTPTRASLMTGRHYQRTGAFDTFMGRDTLRSDEVTLAEVLQKQGYRTAAIGKWHLGRYMRYHPNHRGFDEFFGFWQYGFIHHYQDPDELFENRQPVTATGYITDILTDRAISFLERSRRNPFFLYLPYNAPHAPYLVPDRYIERYLKKGLPLQEARIYGMVTCVDENIGRLLQAIDRLGLRENTAVIFMTDNGGVSRYFKAGLRGNKGSVYEGGVRVPFMARWPGRFPAGATVDVMAQHIDVFPTLCELTETPLPERVLDGKSILPLLLKGTGRHVLLEPPHRYLFHQWNRVRPVLKEPMPRSDGGGPAPNWAVRNARGYKLIHTGELFDLATDPGEKNDVAAQNPEIVREIESEFERWFAGVTAGQDYGRVPIEVGRPDENPVEIDLTWGEAAGEKVRPTYHEYNRDIIENWSRIEDAVRWKIDVVESGRYEVVLEYGCRADDAGSKLRIRVGSSAIDHEVKATAGRDVFRPLVAGTLQLSKGPATLEMKPASIAGAEVMALHKIWLRRLDSHLAGI